MRRLVTSLTHLPTMMEHFWIKMASQSKPTKSRPQIHQRLSKTSLLPSNPNPRSRLLPYPKCLHPLWQIKMKKHRMVRKRKIKRSNKMIITKSMLIKMILPVDFHLLTRMSRRKVAHTTPNMTINKSVLVHHTSCLIILPNCAQSRTNCASSCS